jgi:hypothetical protein
MPGAAGTRRGAPQPSVQPTTARPAARFFLIHGAALYNPSPGITFDTKERQIMIELHH